MVAAIHIVHLPITSSIMIESERALDGVKLLTLSHLKEDDEGRVEKRFDVVDAVCREILLSKVLATAIVSDALPAPPPPAIHAQISAVENRESVHRTTAASATTPFLAVVQYNCLEDDAQLIYGLIQSVMGLQPSENAQATTDVQNENEETLTPVGKFVESKQLTKLQELSSFRKQLMSTIPLHERAKQEAEDDLLLASLDSAVFAKQGPRQGQRQGQGRLRGVPMRRPVR